MGVDDQTPAGTPRELFARVVAKETATLRYYGESGSVLGETEVKTWVTGSPDLAEFKYPARYTTLPGPCVAYLELENVMLHFETADGAFRESIPGVVVSYTSDNLGYHFLGKLTASFSGSYDGTWIAKKFGSSSLSIGASFSPARGLLTADGAANLPNYDSTSGRIAEWTGAGGVPGAGGSTVSGASSDASTGGREGADRALDAGARDTGAPSSRSPGTGGTTSPNCLPNANESSGGSTVAGSPGNATGSGGFPGIAPGSGGGG